MHQQKGSSLIVALILLMIITVVAVYSLEGSNLQSKMIANSLFSTFTYQECRNEQEAQVLFYNIDGGVNRTPLLAIASSGLDENGVAIVSELTQADTLTEGSNVNPPKSDLTIRWRYIKEEPANLNGYDLNGSTTAYTIENDCIANYRFSNNSQTLGASLIGLKQANNLN